MKRDARVDVPTSRLRWGAAWRIIPSRFPPVGLFDRVAAPEDLEKVIELEAKTNDRLRDEAGDLSLVPSDERISGPNTSVIMAAFTHLNPEGSRFSDGSYGVFYASRQRDTAVAETMYHRGRFLRATRQRAMTLDMRAYNVDVDAAMVDLRGLSSKLPSVYSPTDYSASQVFGRAARADGAFGIAWDSVRHRTGQCVGVFRPRALSHCVAKAHLAYVWDGESFIGWYQRSSFVPT